MDIEKVLQNIVDNPSLHPKWLNSLSYLEYRGFRKMVRSQTTDGMNSDLLLHTMEEVRHAVHFKKLAVKFGGPTFSSYKDDVLLSPNAVKGYFYHLDGGTVELLGDHPQEELTNAAYYLVTWLVEDRAMEVYRLYNERLKTKSFNFNLDGILREEACHLSEMADNSNFVLEKRGLSKDRFKDLERRCFQSMWREIEQECPL